MNGDIVEVRNIYSNLRRFPTHIVQSSEIATSCICQNLFKLSYPFGVVKGERDYLIANTVHDIMSLCIGGPVLENWEYRNDYDSLTRYLIRESSGIIEEIIKYTKDTAKRENRFIPDDFEGKVNDIFQGLLIGITKRLMKKYERPKRILTESTITNIKSRQEGRIDALLEYPNRCFGILDWKTYDLSNNINGHEKWQLISNILLANYKYTGKEDIWDKYHFASIIHYTGAYFPKEETVKKETHNIISNRNFAYNVLCGEYVQAARPKFCPVCDKDLEGSQECKFYRDDSRLAYEGKLPSVYDKIRKQFYGKRYEILKERAETHLHKYVVGILIDKFGEDIALNKLEKTGVIHRGYTYIGENDENVSFLKENNNTFLEPRRIVRVIGKEQDIPLLSCISEQASVMEVKGNKLILNFRSKIAVERAKKQLFHLPIIMLRDEINLTRRMLAPIHEFHKLAADIFLPKDLLE